VEPVKATVITVSDRVSRGTADDRSGPAAVAALGDLGFEAEVVVVPDGVESVASALRAAASAGCALIVTTGGTGMSPRDLTPEATRSVIEREAPGLAEAMRHVTFGENPHGMLSRGVCGMVGATLIVNLPGSVRGVEESLAVVAPALRHAVELLSGEESDHGSG
jgi:molybdenum cofactor biosynthesis protein B